MPAGVGRAEMMEAVEQRPIELHRQQSTFKNRGDGRWPVGRGGLTCDIVARDRGAVWLKDPEKVGGWGTLSTGDSPAAPQVPASSAHLGSPPSPTALVVRPRP